MQEPAPPPRVDADLLREFLAGRAAPCPSCQYDLHGLAGDRCPECAADIALHLSAERPLSAAAGRWIAAFGWLILVTSMVRLSFSAYWMWRSRASGVGIDSLYFIRQVAGMALDFGLAVAAGVALLVLAISREPRTARYRRCLRACAIMTAIELVWQLASYVLYLFLG